MKKGIPLALAVIFMAVIGLQMAEPIAAAKIVDKGIKYQPDSQYGNIKSTWKTYQYNKNYLKIKTAVYQKKPGTNRYIFLFRSWTSLKKVSRTKLRINDWPTIEGKRVQTRYVTTTLTAARYYWRVYKPQMM